MKSTLSLAALAAAMAWGFPALTTSDAAWAQEATEGEAAPAEDSATSDNAATEEAAPAEEATTEETAAAEEPGAIQDMTQGVEDAPVTIVEYGSFTCPHCAAWHEESYEQLKEEYIDTGKVRFIFREVYFDRFGLWASMIARCGGEMRFFPIHDMIYEQQREWVGDQQPQTIADNLRRLGLAAGIGQEQLDACLNDAAQAEALIAWYQANAEADAIDSTPTFLINGEKASGEMPYEEFKALVDAQLPEAAQ